MDKAYQDEPTVLSVDSVEPNDMLVAIVDTALDGHGIVYNIAVENEQWFDSYDELVSFYRSLRIKGYVIEAVLINGFGNNRYHVELALKLDDRD